MLAIVMERWFEVRSAGSTVATEVVGGATTFMTMAYILFVNGASAHRSNTSSG